MANIKISEMPSLGAITGAEWLPAYDPTKPVAQQNQRLQIQQILPPGGTTGQLAAKINNDDYAIQWVNPPSGGGGALSVLNIDFTATEATGGISSGLIMSTYNMPASTVPANGELVIESYLSYTQPGQVASNFPDVVVAHKINGFTISARSAPLDKGNSSFEMSGYLKYETRIQALNSTALQYNDGILSELVENFSDGAHRTITNVIPGGSPPTTDNISTIDMTAPAVITLFVDRNGSGNTLSKLIHRFTRVSLITP